MIIHDLIDTPEKWCKRFTALNPAGYAVGSNNPHAVRFCLGGAIMRRWEEQNTKTEQRIEILEWLATEIPARYPLTYDEKPNELMDVVVMWNDHTQTTHEHVMSLVRDLEASLAV